MDVDERATIRKRVRPLADLVGQLAFAMQDLLAFQVERLRGELEATDRETDADRRALLERQIAALKARRDRIRQGVHAIRVAKEESGGS